MIKYSPFVSCDINITAINTIVKTCSVKITTATKVKDTCINKPPLPTDLFEFINTPISCITTTDIDDVEGSNPYSLRDIAVFHITLWKYTPFWTLGRWKFKLYICVKKLDIWLPLLLWINISTPSELLTPTSNWSVWIYKYSHFVYYHHGYRWCWRI